MRLKGVLLSSSFITIHRRRIGPGFPVYIIAELSANHRQSYERAVELVHAAHQAGADAVKLQTYTPDTITIDCDNEYFRIQQGTCWDGKSLYNLYEEAFTPWNWQPKLKTVANDLGMDLFSSPFDATAVEFLEQMNVPAYKIASFEIVDVPLLKKVAATRRPVIVSTGMANQQEIRLALDTLRAGGCDQIALLKCTSAYPASADSMNLRTMADMAQRFQTPVGLSDHSMTSEAAVVSVALGGCIVEKHLTLDRSEGGPDSGFSLQPEEFAEMVRAVRTAEQTLGSVHYGVNHMDRANRNFRRSLFVVRDIAAGEPFTSDNVRSIRPGHGLEPVHFPTVLGRRAAAGLSRGTPLQWKHVS